VAKGRIQPEHKRQPIPGGFRRASVRASLSGLDAVRLRQRLNVKLLARSCGNDSNTGSVLFDAAELPLLLQIAGERVSGTNPLLRRAAVSALGTFQRLEAVEALTRLAASEVEHEALRADAVVALAGASPVLAAAILRPHLKDLSPLVRQSAAIALGRSGTPEAAELLAELARDERDPGVRQRTAAVAESLGIAVRGARPARRKRKATPAVDRARGEVPPPR
jgi:HEAT repeat protein